MKNTQMDIDDIIIEKAEENDCNNVVDLVPFRLGYLAALIELEKEKEENKNDDAKSEI